ncbi:UDP-glucose:protein N-beta-glucosyltransferase [Volucribacter amazonae]|uniref:Adhesin n=1 Tax=Volucribacter amazonae TaxID=256731 RepID=A0A9X4SKJ4_9PAST|nr:adhesin [Volucribacter amazonae]MDG6894073.1 adhesin [Volucribacter amazonae]
MTHNNNIEKVTPSVNTLEQAIATKDYEKSCTELLSILGQLDTNFGMLDNIELDIPPQLNNLIEDTHTYFCTRMAAAITQLFTDKDFNISDSGVIRFLTLQRWLGLIFASSPYVNADHILRSYNVKKDIENPNDVHIAPTLEAFYKFIVLYFPESNVLLNLDTVWDISPELCASLCIALQSPRFLGSEESYNKRAAIIQWLPEKLTQLKDLTNLTEGILHDVYMHCSYDMAPNKHDIKKSLNTVIRRHLIKNGWKDRRNTSKIGEKNNKPVMIVLLEHFNANHSIYRTHSTSMIAAKEHFHLVGLGNSNVDDIGKAVFDEFFVVEGDYLIQKLEYIKKLCNKYKPAIFYMPSIGMDLLTIFASNTRLAPIQAIALGHPATTHSDFIEYVIVEDDYVGSEKCFSETLIRLPKDALPYVPSAAAPKFVEYNLREEPEVVNIGIASTTMKLNPFFLEALREIKDRSKVKVHFHFALGISNGITHPYVARFIRKYLGDSATAHSHKPYNEYLEILNHCDMMLNPFPFGNTNGIIDMVTLGLVGICKTGDEVHEHIDEGLFKRLGLPEWLITHSIEEYIQQAIRLAENHQERLELRKHIIENNKLQTLFTGNPKPMGNILKQKLTEFLEKNN